MKRDEAFLRSRDVKEFLIGVVGEEGVGLVRNLSRVRQIDEFKLAKKLKMEVNVVRSLLYKLYSQKIVSFTKRRDRRKGWWIYIWKLHPEKLASIIVRKRKEELKRIGEKLASIEALHLFQCKRCRTRINYERAMETNFTCSICGRVLAAIDTSEIKENLKREARRIEKEIEKLRKRYSLSPLP
jgi:transcription factor E